MSKYPLVSNAALALVDPELQVRIAALQPAVLQVAGDAGRARAWSLLFEHWPALLKEPSISREDVLYNRYYWFKRYALRMQESDGYDAGIEQQVFRLLEQPEFDIDWAIVEELDIAAAEAHRLRIQVA